ncbi:MAG: FkbM family methyltransferase, partial [Alphaproteobacteria bacterium]|nr:FkbM family methyltransferase [Alphaproteobacteria bacterium]
GDQAELRTIDSFGFRNVSLLKIDVESLEDQVLDGARETILESKPVILAEIQGGLSA